MTCTTDFILYCKGTAIAFGQYLLYKLYFYEQVDGRQYKLYKLDNAPGAGRRQLRMRRTKPICTQVRVSGLSNFIL